MYKTSVITDEISQDLTTAVKIACEYGLQGLEIRTVSGKNPFEMNREDVRFIKHAAEDAGLEICAVSSPMYKCRFDDLRTRAQHEDAFRRFMETMQLWGCTRMRTFDFLAAGEGKDHEILEIYHHLADIAKEAGVTLLLESEIKVTSSCIARLAAFLQKLDRKNVMAVYDPGNEAADLAAPPAYPDGYEHIRPWLGHVHIKDVLSGPERISVPMGEGDVDFYGVFAALRRDGYDGWVSLETRYRMARGPRASFSDGGLEASRLYLDRLRDQYRWMEA